MLSVLLDLGWTRFSSWSQNLIVFLHQIQILSFHHASVTHVFVYVLFRPNGNWPLPESGPTELLCAKNSVLPLELWISSCFGLFLWTSHCHNHKSIQPWSSSKLTFPSSPSPVWKRGSALSKPAALLVLTV